MFLSGLAVLKHTLTPRMKASHIAIDTMKDHLDAVYDVTVAYEGTVDASGQRKPAPSMPGRFLEVNILFDEDGMQQPNPCVGHLSNIDSKSTIGYL